MQGVHFSVCPNEGGVIARHDNVCHDVSSMNHAALMSNKREVLYTDDSAHRADILLDEGCDGNPTILDVNVTEPWGICFCVIGVSAPRDEKPSCQVRGGFAGFFGGQFRALQVFFSPN